MDWTWDPEKERRNRAKHGVGFDLARRALEDPAAATRLDPYLLEERWQTIGKPDAASPVVLMVVHTETETGGRIISARRATRHEREAYEEGEY